MDTVDSVHDPRLQNSAGVRSSSAIHTKLPLSRNLGRPYMAAPNLFLTFLTLKALTSCWELILTLIVFVFHLNLETRSLLRQSIPWQALQGLIPGKSPRHL